MPVGRVAGKIPLGKGRGNPAAAFRGFTYGDTFMKMMLIAALMITLPAIVVVVFFFGTTAMLPALVSLSINSLPFLVAGWLLRKQGGGDLGH